MARDPLDARLVVLCTQADLCAVQLRHTTDAWPWLLLGELDASAEAAGLEADAQSGRAIAASSARAQALHGEAGTRAEELWRAADAWARTLRRAMPRTEPFAPARAALAGRIRAFPDAVSRVPAAVDALAAAPVSGTLAMLLSQGAALRVEVGAHAAALVASGERQASMSERATVDRSALRARLRALRRAWDVARRLSKGAFGPLDLHVSSSEVASVTARLARAVAALAAAELAAAEPVT